MFNYTKYEQIANQCSIGTFVIQGGVPMPREGSTALKGNIL